MRRIGVLMPLTADDAIAQARNAVWAAAQIDGIAVITARQTLRERGQMIPLSVACRAAFGATYRWGAAAP
jgi:hypothetical protein